MFRVPLPPHVSCSMGLASAATAVLLLCFRLTVCQIRCISTCFLDENAKSKRKKLVPVTQASQYLVPAAPCSSIPPTAVVRSGQMKPQYPPLTPDCWSIDNSIYTAVQQISGSTTKQGVRWVLKKVSTNRGVPVLGPRSLRGHGRWTV